jgi:hypothetical protein
MIAIDGEKVPAVLNQIMENEGKHHFGVFYDSIKSV